MTKQALVSGLIVGLLASLGLLYPALVLIVLRDAPGADRLGRTDPMQAVYFILSGALIMSALFLAGTYPAVRIKATRWRTGAQAGLLSGLIAALVVFVIVVMPANAWQANVPLFTYSPLRYGSPPDSLVSAYLQRVLVYAYVRILPIMLLGGGLLGWLEGGFAGALRRDDRSRAPLALIDVIADRRGHRRWFADNNDTGRAGLIAGLLCGGLIIIAALSTASTDLAAQAPRLNSVVANALASVPGAAAFNNSGLGNALAPVSTLLLLVFGALAILFVRDPARRFASRIGAAAIAGGFIGAAIYFNLTRVILILIGLGSYTDYDLIDAPTLANGAATLGAPSFVAVAYFLVPLAAVIVLICLMMLAGAAQGLLYGFLIPIVLRRPADRAAQLSGRLRDDETQFLPQLYNLYNEHADTKSVLPHLAFYIRRQQPDMARLIAAQHLAVTQPERAAAAIALAGEALAPHETWHWRSEVGALYRIMRAGLAARTLEHVADIEPLPETQTTSLPLMLSRASDAVTRVLNELKKIERVDDVNSKLILLNNALDAIRAGQRHAETMRVGYASTEQDWSSVGDLWRQDPQLKIVNEKFKAVQGPEDILPALRQLGQVNWRHNIQLSIRRAEQINQQSTQDRQLLAAAAYPEAAPLRQLLDYWQGLVMERVKDLQGRAALISALKATQLNFAARLPVTLTIKNAGLNIAEQVRLVVSPSPAYHVLEGGQQQIDLLTAGSARDLDVVIEPLTRDRVRLQWQLIYDDAVDDDRVIEAADVIEFEQSAAQRPFVRIFPIPYVTGMPLKTNHLFVGRDDIFAYIQEHLFGAYQNNVIVLHGQRRTGKTSILYRLKKVLADSHVCVLVDMQGKAARGTLDFLYSLADDIVYELEDNQLQVALPPRSDFAESPEFVFRSRFLRGVCAALPPTASGGRKHLLLMFDEFEELQKRVQDGKLEPEIFPFLRNLMQHEDCVDFVFAGTHKLEELGAEYWSILFNIASYKKITFLTPDDAKRLITEPVAPHLEYDPLAIERIIDVSGGHPYFTQVICHELVAYHNETQRSYLTANDVEEVLDRIVERGEAHFKFIWAEATAQQRATLLALADLLETDELAAVDQVQALLDKRAISLDGTPLTGVLDDLELGDILTRSGPRSSLYRFKIDLIRRWIYATRPN